MAYIETNQEIRRQVITLLVIERDQNAERLTQCYPIEYKRSLSKEKPEPKVQMK